MGWKQEGYLDRRKSIKRRGIDRMGDLPLTCVKTGGEVETWGLGFWQELNLNLGIWLRTFRLGRCKGNGVPLCFSMRTQYNLKDWTLEQMKWLD